MADILGQLAGGESSDIWRNLARLEIHPRSVVFIVRRESFFLRAGEADHQIARLRERLVDRGRIAADPADDDLVRVTVACRLKLGRGSVRIIDGVGRSLDGKPALDPALIAALKTAHGLLSGADPEEAGRIETATLDAAPADPYDRARLRLAFLAPDLQAAILAGRQPAGVDRQRLVFGAIPLAWEDQRKLFAEA